ncbi:MAG: hypothetical protein AAB802_03270 [Patescibacteria group bacterium]
MGKFKEGDTAYLYTGERLHEDPIEIMEIEILQDLSHLLGREAFRIRVLQTIKSHTMWTDEPVGSQGVIDHVGSVHWELFTPAEHTRVADRKVKIEAFEAEIKALEAYFIGMNKELTA